MMPDIPKKDTKEVTIEGLIWNAFIEQAGFSPKEIHSVIWGNKVYDWVGVVKSSSPDKIMCYIRTQEWPNLPGRSVTMVSLCVLLQKKAFRLK